MYVVFGGKFNGKRDYVIKTFAPTIFVSELQQQWAGEVICVTGFEQLVKPFLHLEEQEAANEVVAAIGQLAQENTVICICDDVTRGLVPLDPTERKKRDVLGRIYQQLFQQADSVTRIWYGLVEKIKEAEHE